MKIKNKAPIVIIYHTSKVFFTMAHKIYHSFQYTNYNKQYRKAQQSDEWLEQLELEAQAFAVAYVESIHPSIEVTPIDMYHPAISKNIRQNTNKRDEMIVIRAIAKHSKKNTSMKKIVNARSNYIALIVQML